MKNILYGNLKVDMKLWSNLTSSLQDWVLQIKPYDLCVVKKKVNSKQIIVVWHVDYLKISHVESDVVKEMISQLSKLYRKDTYLKIHRGKVHYYLGI